MYTDGFYGRMILIKFFENHTLPKVLFRTKFLFLSKIYSARDYLTLIVVYIYFDWLLFFSSFKWLRCIFGNNWKHFSSNHFQTDSISRCLQICRVKYNFTPEQEITEGSNVIKISLRRYSRVWNQMYSLADIVWKYNYENTVW